LKNISLELKNEAKSIAFHMDVIVKPYFWLEIWVENSSKTKKLSKIDCPPYGCHSEASFFTTIVS